jgi:hypothetical protein
MNIEESAEGAPGTKTPTLSIPFSGGARRRASIAIDAQRAVCTGAAGDQALEDHQKLLGAIRGVLADSGFETVLTSRSVVYEGSSDPSSGGFLAYCIQTVGGVRRA